MAPQELLSPDTRVQRCSCPCPRAALVQRRVERAAHVAPPLVTVSTPRDTSVSHAITQSLAPALTSLSLPAHVLCVLGLLPYRRSGSSIRPDLHSHTHNTPYTYVLCCTYIPGWCKGDGGGLLSPDTRVQRCSCPCPRAALVQRRVERAAHVAPPLVTVSTPRDTSVSHAITQSLAPALTSLSLPAHVLCVLGLLPYRRSGSSIRPFAAVEIRALRPQ